MLSFCTLFDVNYLSRGLALYSSLIRHEGNAELYVYCLDKQTHDVLTRLGLPGLKPVAMEEFESPELLAVKPSREVGEYCWTCTPHVIRHAIRRFELSAITYVDSDLYFYCSPMSLLDEWDKSGASVLITEHRYTPRFDNSRLFGTYCVQFITFRANAAGMVVLDWWADRCLEWCFARAEDGKFGDQKYLDDWPARFAGVHVLQHLGGGVAPWNVQQYQVSNAEGQSVRLQELSTGKCFPLVFYHFHGLQIFTDGEIDLSTYPMGEDVRIEVYGRYLDGLREVAKLLVPLISNESIHGLRHRPSGAMAQLQNFKRRIERRLSGALNVMRVSDLRTLR